MRITIVGRGRAGGAFAEACRRVGIAVDHVAGRGGEIDTAGADLVLLCVPDDAIASAAERLRPTQAVVAHCAGSRGLDVLGEHARVASIHPLMSLPDAGKKMRKRNQRPKKGRWRIAHFCPSPTGSW